MRSTCRSSCWSPLASRSDASWSHYTEHAWDKSRGIFGPTCLGNAVRCDVIVPIRRVNEALAARHYLGATKRGIAWQDEFGIMVWAAPTSRRLPHDRWLELVRWCLRGQKNDGSQQFKRFRRWLRKARPDVTTLVSYSDPSVGHTGALYKACGWTWAPTWHRLFPPPSGNGDWGSGAQAVKDRWIYALKPDAQRAELLRVKDGRVTTHPATSRRIPSHHVLDAREMV